MTKRMNRDKAQGAIAAIMLILIAATLAGPLAVQVPSAVILITLAYDLLLQQEQKKNKDSQNSSNSGDTHDGYMRQN